MPNHLHLLILSGARGLVSLMHPLLTGYATTFNRRYARAGHLFQNRYRSILCEEDPYFLELIRYIHLNPVRARLVQSLEELARYPWTGHSALMGRIPRPWQETDGVLGHFGSTFLQSRQAYERLLLDGWNQGKQKHLEGLEKIIQPPGGGVRQAYDTRILGGVDFVEQIWNTAEKEDRQKRDSLQSGWTLEQLQERIAGWVGVDPGAISRPDRHRLVAQARALFVYAGIDWLGKSGQEMANVIGISPPSVCEARERGRRLADRFDLRQILSKT